MFNLKLNFCFAALTVLFWKLGNLWDIASRKWLVWSHIERRMIWIVFCNLSISGGSLNCLIESQVHFVCVLCNLAASWPTPLHNKYFRHCLFIWVHYQFIQFTVHVICKAIQGDLFPMELWLPTAMPLSIHTNNCNNTSDTSPHFNQTNPECWTQTHRNIKCNLPKKNKIRKPTAYIASAITQFFFSHSLSLSLSRLMFCQNITNECRQI